MRAFRFVHKRQLAEEKAMHQSIQIYLQLPTSRRKSNIFQHSHLYEKSNDWRMVDVNPSNRPIGQCGCSQQKKKYNALYHSKLFTTANQSTEKQCIGSFEFVHAFTQSIFCTRLQFCSESMVNVYGKFNDAKEFWHRNR